MSKRLWIIVWALLITVYGCSGVRVSQDYQAGTNFSGLQTYDWKPAEQAKSESTQADPLMADRIRKAVEATLASKGFRKETQRPDFYIGYNYTVRQKIESDGVRTSVGFGTWGGGTFGGVGFGGPGYGVDAYDEGLLYIDVIDPKSGDLLWRGKGTYRAEQHLKPEEATQRVNEAVDKILNQFPP